MMRMILMDSFVKCVVDLIFHWILDALTVARHHFDDEGWWMMEVSYLSL